MVLPLIHPGVEAVPFLLLASRRGFPSFMAISKKKKKRELHENPQFIFRVFFFYFLVTGQKKVSLEKAHRLDKFNNPKAWQTKTCSIRNNHSVKTDLMSFGLM